MTRNSTITLMMRGCAAAALLALPMGSAALAQEQGAAQQSQEQAQQQPQPDEQQGDAQQPQQAQQQGDAQQQQTQQAQGGTTGQAGPDALVATVGDEEIHTSEVMTVIGTLPEPLRAQQPDMLVPIALDQLILRELIMQEAQAQNLREDPEVQQLVQNQSQTAQDDAMVQVWLQRELNDRVTDQQVQQTYDRIASGAQEGAQVPPLEAVRPQIEQQLRQQAPGEIRASLREGADITFYGPEGQPIQEGVNQGQPGSTPDAVPAGPEGQQEGQQPG